MALFTDGNIATLNDLRGYETAILDLASSEGIDLGAKLALGHREIGFEVLSFLLTQGYALANERNLDSVVVTDPLPHAEIMWTLGLVYRDAYNSQLNDRYEGKWKQYTDLSRRALGQYFEIGVGLISCPIPKPEPASTQLTSGGPRAAVTYTVQVASCGLDGFTSALSDPVILHAPDSTRLSIALGSELPSRAVGWFLYLGTGDSAPVRQNDQPFQAGDIWTVPDEGPVTGLPAARIQQPQMWATQRRRLLRG